MSNNAAIGDTTFVGVRIVGGLLPADVLARLGVARDMDGMSPADYHLAGGETVRDAANRVWAYLRGAWRTFQDGLEKLPEDDPATRLTREKFLLPLLDQLGYGRVPTTAAGGLRPDDDTEHRFPISHLWNDAVPIHLLGAGIDLDKRRAGVAGAAKSSPQSMVQEYLNRTDKHLWAILANGHTVRLLRDSTSLVGSAYIEFDLDAIFGGELFSDFLLLYTLCHQSRLEPRDAEIGQSSCWLEKWRETAADSGTRALRQLSEGVKESLEILGNGFLNHPANESLREQLATGTLTDDDVHHGLLRLAYRLLFTFVAEDRGALLAPGTRPEVRKRYARYFSTARLRTVARRRLGDRHSDRWEAQKLVWQGLSQPEGMAELGLPALGGLFENGPLDFLLDHKLQNSDLLAAIRSLALVTDKKSGKKWPVDYRNLGAEELGSIYESLLEYHPSWDPATKHYTLASAAGNERKGTGSYYTPISLVECLLDSTLNPLLAEAAKATDPEKAYLAITVCDPACGSGHFLVAAARRIAKRVAAHRTGDPEPPPEQIRDALRDVVARCIYGVDVNPLAAELAKVSLWLEALEPGKPLAFLDAQIKVGNALIGATPRLLDDGIPNDAFKPIEGDEKKVATALANRNQAERSGQLGLFDTKTLATSNSRLGQYMREVIAERSQRLEDIHVQQKRLRDYTQSAEYQHQKLIADAWCASFVWLKTHDAPDAITHGTFTKLLSNVDILTPEQRNEVKRLATQYRFFHWHLEYPHIFPISAENICDLNRTTGWSGGFNSICANPPWDKIDFDDTEYFASVHPQIAAIAGTARRTAVAQWIADNPAAGQKYLADRRHVKGMFHFVKKSGTFPQIATPVKGVNSVQIDHLFAEQMATLTSSHGRSGAILPTTIANGAGAQHLFSGLVRRASISLIFDFENVDELFPIHRSYRFSLFAIVGHSLHEPRILLAFGLRNTKQLHGDRIFELTPKEVSDLNPNTGTCPIFRTRRDAEITLSIYKRVPVLLKEGDPNGNPWGITFKQGLFNMTDDWHLFRTCDQLNEEGWTLRGSIFELDGKRMLPLREGKMMHHFDHRWGTFMGISGDDIRSLASEEKNNPTMPAMPRYWVPEFDVPTASFDRRGRPTYYQGVASRLADLDWRHDWLLGWRDVCRATDERTAICGIMPTSGISNTNPLLFAGGLAIANLAPVLSSFVFDFVCRQKQGGMHLTVMTMKQLPVLSPAQLAPHTRFLTTRQLELTFTTTDLSGFANDLGADGSPYFWDDNRRSVLRAEIDAYLFVLYGLSRDEVDYVMESFQTTSGGFKNKELSRYGSYRMKEMILDCYDRMTTAGLSIDNPLIDGKSYFSELDIQPGQGPRHE
ncbi:Eco57I restriction-modification methylase domain-containing protein [Lolliginicoccus levis]|uniref:Eco57I restriction-modification methylase domain-containing protein n=1 Tax=Lolliginicoccus levis TaxID=2919542 RepID=UPI00242018DC|nr:N-6 DNA methylase [Lolliginicoccus levis]